CSASRTRSRPRTSRDRAPTRSTSSSSPARRVATWVLRSRRRASSRARPRSSRRSRRTRTPARSSPAPTRCSSACPPRTPSRASSVTGIPVAEFETAMADTAATGLPAEANGNYEGWLYPTTYVLAPGDVSAQGVIRNMVSQTVMKLDELGVAPADRESVLNKASLIEREAKYAPDRPKMARAIENRLATDMALQIDAAVAYGLDKPGTELTRDDTRNPDNPYNTYVHKGLPPTPIASPGADSLAAVVNPEPGDW